ncbi:MAG: family 16 glycosylhydrolase [Bacteroidota bacterium]
MKTADLILLLLLTSLLFVHCQSATNTPEEKQPNITSRQKKNVLSDEWILIWKDEFEVFDTSKWTKVNALGGVNNEQQLHYPQNVYIDKGMLVIEARKQDEFGTHYASGKITSRNKFSLKYGKVELRLKTAATSGTQTVFWLLHDACDGVNPCIGNWPPEIDVVEVLGKEANKIYQVIHYSTSPKGRWPDWDFSSTATELSTSSSPSSTFHTYTLEWDTNSVRWYIDQQLTKTWIANNQSSFSPDESMFLIFNIAIGGDWAGSPTENSIWPQRAYLDWVRVYRKNHTDQPQPVKDSSSIFYIQNVATAYYLTANGLANGEVSLVQAALGNNWINQKWRINQIEEEWFTLHPAFKDSLAVTFSSQNELPIFLSPYRNLDRQKWKIVEQEEGKVHFVAKPLSNMMLSASKHENWSSITLQDSEDTMSSWLLEPITTLERTN